MHALESNYWWFVGRRAIIGRLLQSVVGAAPKREAARLLDIGCGTGANLAMLRSVLGSQASLTGVDFSSLALRFAREVNAAQGVSLARCDALRLPFASGSFDVATALDVLEHLRDDVGALQEVRRVLRPGGAFVWSVPAYQHLWSAHDEALHHFRRYEWRSLRSLLLRSGFRVEKLSFAMSLMPPLAWAWRKAILPFVPRRERSASRHSQGAVLPTVPPLINRALVKYLEVEGGVITRRPILFGTSLVGVARRV
jgi:ubiquinone/menaquinone biosynthesis C-methylase UbiE